MNKRKCIFLALITRKHRTKSAAVTQDLEACKCCINLNAGFIFFWPFLLFIILITSSLYLYFLTLSIDYGGGLVTQSCTTLCNPMDFNLLTPLSMGFSTGVSCHFLLQGIFLTQGSNPGSPACQADSLPTEPPRKLLIEYIHALLFSWKENRV